MNEARMKWFDRVVGPLLGLGALWLYLSTLSAGAYPGESAVLVAQYFNLHPVLAPDHPIWNGLMRLWSLLPLGGPVHRMNLLSAVLGGLSIWMLYQLVTGAVWRCIDEVEQTPLTVIAARLAGLGSAVFFALCIPFWIVCTRAHTAPLDIVLVLGCVGLLVRYMDTDRWFYVGGFALLYGLSLAEFATQIVLFPLYFMLVVTGLQKHERLSMRNALLLSLLALVGAGGLYVWNAWQFLGTPGHAVVGTPSLGKVLWSVWRDQYFLIIQSLPRVGWLVILCLTVAPFLAALMVARRALNREADWAIHILHVVMTGLVVSVGLNAAFSPWYLLGFQRILVTPYLLSAALYGYLITYWFLLPAGWWTYDDQAWRIWLRRIARVAVCLPFVGILAVMPQRNLREADGRSSAFVDQYVQQMISSLDGRTWLVDTGPFDAMLLVAARDAGVALQTLNLGGDENQFYMKHTAGLLNRVELKNRAQVGLLPMAREWFAIDKEIPGKVVVAQTPSLWTENGYEAVPHKLVFLGAKDVKAEDLQKLQDLQVQVWKELTPALADSSALPKHLAPLAAFIRRHMGILANELGCLLENQGREVEAFQSYARARDVDPENISALLNQAAMIERGFVSDQADRVSEALKEAAQYGYKMQDLKALARAFGTIRTPWALGREGWGWARAGQTERAVQSLQKAIELAPEAHKRELERQLAVVLLLENRLEEAETILNRILKDNPADIGALVATARLSLKCKDYARCDEFLNRAEKAGAPKEKVAEERAVVAIERGNLAEAQQNLQDLLEMNPDRVTAWAMLISALVSQKDKVGLERCVSRMESVGSRSLLRDYVVASARGHLALLDRSPSRAHAEFSKALAVAPADLGLLNVLLQIELREGSRVAAEDRARTILRLDPGNVAANRVMALIQMEREEYDVAGDSLRRAMEPGRTSDLYNDLAWLRQLEGKLPEAESMAREALKLDAKNAHALDTLGVILARLGRIAEAEDALKRSLELAGEEAWSTILHLMDVYRAQGNADDKVMALNEKLNGREYLLSAPDQQRLREIRVMMKNRQSEAKSAR